MSTCITTHCYAVGGDFGVTVERRLGTRAEAWRRQWRWDCGAFDPALESECWQRITLDFWWGLTRGTLPARTPAQPPRHLVRSILQPSKNPDPSRHCSSDPPRHCPYLHTQTLGNT